MPASVPEPALPPVPAHVPPLVLVFAASDPTGGAGLQADVLTLTSMGCHPLTVVTALTIQDTTGVEAVMPVDGGWISDQARVLLEDMPVSAFKLGLLGSVEAVAAVAEILSDYPDIPCVFDPVLTSGRGDALADEEIIEAMTQLLLPLTTVLTPNSLEARRLAQVGGDDEDNEGDGDRDSAAPDLAGCARHLVAAGCDYVLITGSHEGTPQVINTLYGSHGAVRSDTWERLPGSYHGSGCTLASAIAANLAAGLDVPEAVRDAEDYTWQTLAAGFRPGMGQYIPDRFFWARERDGEESDERDTDQH